MDYDNQTNEPDQPVYSRDFKLSAVTRLKSGESAVALARELGIRRNLLYKWRQQVEMKGEAEAFKDLRGRPRAIEEDELTRLRRENDRLQMENEILKKAQAYFASRKR